MEPLPPLCDQKLRDTLAGTRDAGAQALPRGLGTRSVRPLPPPQAAVRELRAPNGVLDFDPREQVLTAGAGTPLSDIEATIRSENLALPSLIGSPFHGSLGGLYSDPRETPTWPQLGRVRDHVLGIEALRGDGTEFRAGGRVVKNVTGYDLTRFLCGARGAWGLVTKLHWRLQPRPELLVESTFGAPDDETLWQACDRLRAAPWEPLRVTWHPKDRVLGILEGGREASIRARMDWLREALAEAGMSFREEAPAPEFEAKNLAPPRESTAHESTARWRFRVRLPYSSWRDFDTASPKLEWEAVYPSACFGIARLAVSAEDRFSTIESLRQDLTHRGGSIVPEEWQADMPMEWDVDWVQDDSVQSRLDQALRDEWDPQRSIWTPGPQPKSVQP